MFARNDVVTPNPRISVRGPAAIDWQSGAGDRRRRIARQKYRERAELFDGRKALVGLLRQQHVVNDLFAGNSVSLGLTVDLASTSGV